MKRLFIVNGQLVAQGGGVGELRKGDDGMYFSIGS